MTSSNDQNGKTKRFSRGARFVVRSFLGSDTDLLRRLLTLGLVAGAELEVLNVAPLGDPIQFRTGGYHLSLRASELENLRLESINTNLPD